MNTTSTRLFGICMILSFISYATGMGLMESVYTPTLQPATLLEQKYVVITGGILVTVFHTVFNIILITAMFNRILPFHKELSGIYLGAGLFGTTLLAIGGIFMMVPVAAGIEITNPGNKEQFYFSSVVLWCSKVNFYAYQVGMFLWGLGGLALSYILYTSKLVPMVFAIWGCIGYIFFIAGICFELLGLSLGLFFSVPGGLFELTMSVWLIKKGFLPGKQ